MKKQYIQPQMEVIAEGPMELLAGSFDENLNNDPTNPGNALSRRHDVWEDDWDEE